MPLQVSCGVMVSDAPVEYTQCVCHFTEFYTTV